MISLYITNNWSLQWLRTCFCVSIKSLCWPWHHLFTLMKLDLTRSAQSLDASGRELHTIAHSCFRLALIYSTHFHKKGFCMCIQTVIHTLYRAVCVFSNMHWAFKMHAYLSWAWSSANMILCFYSESWGIKASRWNTR